MVVLVGQFSTNNVASESSELLGSSSGRGKFHVGA